MRDRRCARHGLTFTPERNPHVPIDFDGLLIDLILNEEQRRKQSWLVGLAFSFHYIALVRFMSRVHPVVVVDLQRWTCKHSSLAPHRRTGCTCGRVSVAVTTVSIIRAPECVMTRGFLAVSNLLHHFYLLSPSS